VSVATAPTLALLQRTLAGFRSAMAGDRKRGDEPVVFLTFSGHGAVDEHGRYFLSLLDGGLTRQQLYDEGGLEDYVRVLLDKDDQGLASQIADGVRAAEDGSVGPMTSTS
jgi:hypothetical protein